MPQTTPHRQNHQNTAAGTQQPTGRAGHTHVT